MEIQFSQCKKTIRQETVTDRLKAVRETGVSRHHGGPIEGPLKPPVHHSTIILRGLRGYLKEMEIQFSQCEGRNGDVDCAVSAPDFSVDKFSFSQHIFCRTNTIAVFFFGFLNIFCRTNPIKLTLVGICRISSAESTQKLFSFWYICKSSTEPTLQLFSFWNICISSTEPTLQLFYFWIFGEYFMQKQPYNYFFYIC